MIPWKGGAVSPADWNGKIVLVRGHNDPNSRPVFDEALYDWQWQWKGDRAWHVIGYNLTQEELADPGLLRAQVWG